MNNIFDNKHSDACIYLPPYKLDVLKIVEYKFSCEIEAHVEVTTSLMFDCNTFKDKRHLLYVLYNKKCKWYFLSQYFLSVCSSICAGTFCLTIVLHIKKTCKEHLKMAAIFGEGKIF